ncbi:dynamin family protein [Micromonospora sp. CPCC 206060]|uniref:dynamin family protein n=1 Tax=Micromonospora sp. CPCC 206060 TaxID=3122406 RepID=UPI002FF0B2D2
MSGEPPRRRGAAALAAAAHAVHERPALRRWYDALEVGQRQLAEPLRVAVVGRVSAGKSTLVNALLGADVAPTAVNELTANTTWFVPGAQPTVMVHFRDGRPPAVHSPDRLADLAGAARDDEGQQGLLAAVDRIVVTHPSPALRAFHLVDTPGLDSVVARDSQTTLRLLDRSRNDHAHAVVMVIRHTGLAEGLRTLVTDPTDNADGTGPVTTVGAMTWVESFWPRHPDPLARAAAHAGELMTGPTAGRTLFTLRPVASLLACGAATLTDGQYDDLTALAPFAGADPLELSPLRRFLRNRAAFAGSDTLPVPVPPQRRATLWRRLSPYGIDLACRVLRERHAGDLPQLRDLLLAHSGIVGFTRLLTDHFGRRADLVKLRGLLDQMYHLRDELADTLHEGRDRSALRDATRALLRYDLDEPGFDELGVLRDLHAGRLVLGDADATDVRRVTGEFGTDPADRLGLPAGADPALLAATALSRFGHWAARAAATGRTDAERRAAQVVRRGYEQLLGQLVVQR